MNEQVLRIGLKFCNYCKEWNEFNIEEISLTTNKAKIDDKLRKNAEGLFFQHENI